MSEGTPEPERPSWIRRLYDWTLSWAHRPHGTLALGGLSFIESSVFPIPPDPLLMALCFGRPKHWWIFAFWCSAASVAGGVLGWWIGMTFWDATQHFFYDVVPGFTPERFAKVEALYQQNAFVAIVTAAFTPIPYKVFTIASGVFHVGLPVVVGASVLGRSARFFLVAGLIGFCGPAIKPWLEKYLEVATVVFFVLGVAGFVLLKYLL